MDLQGMRRSFDIGGAFVHAYRIFIDNFVVFMVLQVATSVVLGVVQALAVFGGVSALETRPDGGNDLGASGPFAIATFVVMVMGFVFSMGLSQALGAYGGLCRLEDRKAGFRDAWSVGWRNAFPAAGIVAVTVLATYIGGLLFVVPGIVASIFLSMAVPALVIDKAGWGAFGRSAEISENYRLPLFGYLLLSRFAIIIAAAMLMSLVSIGNLFLPTGGGSGTSPTAIAVALIASLFWGVVIGAAALAFGAASAGAYVSFRQKSWTRNRERTAELFS